MTKLPASSPAAFDVLMERLHHHQELLNYSPRTWESQGAYLRLFGRFLSSRGVNDVQRVSALLLREFQHWLFHEPTPRGNARSAVNQNQVLVAVKNFFRLLKAEGVLARDPSEELAYVRQPKTLPRNVLTPEEARQILETPDTQTLLGYRDRTLLEVFYATGIRKEELRNLTVGNVDLEQELLRVNDGKGAKDRVTPLTRVAASFLENYLRGVRPDLLRGATTDRLFVSIRATPLSKTALGNLVKKYARLARVKKTVTCHVWRHSCATHLLKNNANLRHVQELLGHRSLATTERYLHLTITDLKEAHRKFHPRERTRAAEG